MPIYSPCTWRRRRILASLNTARSSTVPLPKFITYSLTADQKKIFATARLPASRPCRRKLLGDDDSWFARKFAVISVSLGLINLVPIPVLDGGHLLFNFFEALMGRPLKPHIQQIGQTVGLVLIIALMVWVTGKDILGLAS